MQIFYYLIPTFWNAITIAASVPIYDHPVRICHQIWTSKTSLRICKGVGKKGFCYVNLLQKKWEINTNSISIQLFQKTTLLKCKSFRKSNYAFFFMRLRKPSNGGLHSSWKSPVFFCTQVYEFLQIDKQIKLLFVAWPFHICQHFHDGKIFFGKKLR